MANSTGQNLRLDMSPHEREARQYAERVYRTLVALEPLYDIHDAIEWLTSQQACIAHVPAKALGMHSGTAAVQQALAIILDGAFA